MQQKGSALLYILIAIALLAALTVSFMDDSAQQQTRTQSTFRVAQDIVSQHSMIRTSIQQCMLEFPQGDAAITTANAMAVYPNDSDGTTPIAASTLTCPGSTASDKALFGAATSRFLPKAPDAMDEWEYANVGSTAQTIYGQSYQNSVFYVLKSNKTDPFIDEAFKKVDEQLSACEVEYLDSSSSTVAGCSAGYRCLRFMLVRGTGPASCP